MLLVSKPNLNLDNGLGVGTVITRKLEIATLLRAGFEYKGNYSHDSRRIPNTNLTMFVEGAAQATSDFATSLSRFISTYGGENVCIKAYDKDGKLLQGTTAIWVRKKVNKK